MKQLLALVFSVLSFVVLADQTPSPSWQAPLANKSLLLDITSVNNERLVAVGEYGHILVSSDGQQWQQASVPVTSTLTAVFFVNSMKGWAVGHDATILHSSDGGSTWSIQQYLPELEKPLLDVVFKDDKNGIAIGAYGMFYRTSDGGETWQNQFHESFLFQDDIDYLNELKKDDEEAYLDERSSILPHFNRVTRDGRTLYMVGEIGLIAKSNDFGESWEQFDDIYQGSFFDLARTRKGNLLVVGLRGNAFRSLRNGTPWERADTGTKALLNSIVLTDTNLLYVLGNAGMLLASDDDGQTFTQYPQADGKALIAGAVFQGKLIVVSDVGIKTITTLK
ncbi:hypothetical protein LP316_11835 [Thalassotalea sp. LPB0316]|uniref:WD40/YVTN/BNR-like repeat-containing protein n=1 Tax=Thalassotalea sp. LPB0316 TaxID=2769490 RepID=UPI001865DCC3|nr:YCF48-related protein [Thalassotalea sp. LPB0316]QOL24992.1 hypothetical protein LP316_11835 [Thalassotalea sp. LPB0316]